MTVAAFVIVIAGMKAAVPVLAPFLLSLFIALISVPPMFWLQRHGMPTALAMLVIVTGLALIGVFLFGLVGNSVNDLLGQVPEYEARLKAYFGSLLHLLDGFGLALSWDDIAEIVDPGKALGMFATTLRGFGGVLTNIVLIFFTVVFILLEAAAFPSKLKNALDNPEKDFPRFQRYAATLHRYMAIKSVISLITGVAIYICVSIIGLDYPLLWGVSMFALNFVPNIGPVIAAVPAIMLALVQLGPGQALFVALSYLGVNVVMGNIVEPRFMGRGLGLSTLVVFLSLVFWGWVFGPVGMLLSVPLTVAVKIALDGDPHTHWVAVLLGTQEDESALADASPGETPAKSGALTGEP